MSNRLSESTSPYLLQHSENPVDWYPWSEEALDLAKSEDKPIFLSVGYAACHWCHVMAHESFEDPETASVMNENFINIKVDREERPDIDALYMNAVVAMTGQGGWPMSVFLTPDGKPFYGGTYFPPVPRFNMPSFKDLLQQIAELWQEDRTDLLTKSDQLTDQINNTPGLTPAVEGIDKDIFPDAAQVIFRRFDWTNGGWGAAPKFPQASVIEFLFRQSDRNDDKLAMDMATKTLDAMAMGGMYDIIGGGFHRYSVDEFWLVPHFEKMLYDNAQLLETYLHAWLITGNETYRNTALETLEFMNRELRDLGGGYYSSLDADSEGEEGTYYIWSQDEISEALQDDALVEIVTEAFGFSNKGNFEGKNIPTWRTSINELAESRNVSAEYIAAQIDEAKSKLLQFRSQRIRPGLDDKVLMSWNGLTLKALSIAARVLSSETIQKNALDLADFLLEEMVVEGKLMRSWRKGKSNFTAYLEDHASLGLGLLELYQVDFNDRWYQAALRQADEILANFKDPRGGFFDTRHDHEQLIARPKGLQDSPLPSGNTLAVTLLLKLAALTGDGRFSDPAESAIRAIQSNAAQYPSAFGGWLCAADFGLGPQLQLALIGNRDEPAFKKLLDVPNQQFLPRLVMASAPAVSDHGPNLLDGKEQIDGSPTAYLCQGFACKLPTTSADELRTQIDEARAV